MGRSDQALIPLHAQELIGSRPGKAQDPEDGIAGGSWLKVLLVAEWQVLLQGRSKWSTPSAATLNQMQYFCCLSHSSPTPGKKSLPAWRSRETVKGRVDLPGGPLVKNLPSNAKDVGSTPG